MRLTKGKCFLVVRRDSTCLLRRCPTGGGVGVCTSSDDEGSEGLTLTHVPQDAYVLPSSLRLRDHHEIAFFNFSELEETFVMFPVAHEAESVNLIG